METAEDTSCLPTLDKLETYTKEMLELALDAHGMKYDDDYDHYDLLALVFLAFKIDCPHYSKEEIEEIRSGKKVHYHGSKKDPVSVRKLLPLQRKLVDQLIKISLKHSVILLMAEPGTGKTLMSLAFCILTKRKAFVITKSAIVSSFVELAKKFGMYFVISNLSSYSLAIRGKEYDVNTYNEEHPDKSIIVSKYIKRVPTTKPGKKRDEIFWQGDIKNTVFIFDEPHNAKNDTSLAHEVLTSNYRYIRTYPERDNILLPTGATPADKITNLAYLTYILGITDKKGRDLPDTGFDKIPGTNYFVKLHNFLFNKSDPVAARVTKRELEDELGISPPVTITLKAYLMTPEAEKLIEENNQYIADLLSGLIKKPQAAILQEIVRARQVIELEKVPTLIDLTLEGLRKGQRILIFVEFHKSSNALYSILKDYGAKLFTGETPRGVRPKLMKDFRFGKFPILIAHHAIADEGISLHAQVKTDTLVLISPVWGGTRAAQILKRTDRLCRLSATYQFIVYVRSSDPNKRSWDERVAEVMTNKLKNINQLAAGAGADTFMADLYREASTVREVKTKTLLLGGRLNKSKK